MIIGVDGGCLGVKDKRLQVGVYQMATNVLHALGKIDTTNTYILYSFYPIDKQLLHSFGKNFLNRVVKPVKGWTKIWLPLQLIKDKPDIFIGLNQSLPLKLPLQTYKSIVIIHDLLFEVYPKLYPGSYRKLHRESKLASFSADTIIVPSCATKHDVVQFYRVPEEKIHVALEGVRELPLPEGNKRTLPYFLFAGALKPQKNIPVLLKAFNHLVSSDQGRKDLELVIVGGDKWMDKRIEKTMKTLPKSTQERVHFLGAVSDAVLVNLYTHAIAFVSPSLSEGFGLPFLEALSCGVPAIGPKTGAVPEVIGKAGILVDPTDSVQVARAMKRMLQKDVREEFVKKTKVQAAKFSWDSFAAQLQTAIERLS